MKEVVFIRRNIEKWRQTEQIAEHSDATTPEVLADAYLDTTSDLAFAQSHYPESRITIYLNGLASALHTEIYANKREKWSRILTFWTREVPQTMWEERRQLLVSFVERLREEQRFENVEALINQLQQDAVLAEQILTVED